MRAGQGERRRAAPLLGRLHLRGAQVVQLQVGERLALLHELAFADRHGGEHAVLGRRQPQHLPAGLEPGHRDQGAAGGAVVGARGRRRRAAGGAAAGEGGQRDDRHPERAGSVRLRDIDLERRSI
jgi:hypothetical protein